MKLSDTQRVILTAAAQHEMGLARAPKSLPAAARNAVFRSMIKASLLTEINAPREHVGLGWRQDEDGTWIVARITDEGLRAIGIDPNENDSTAADDATQHHREEAAQDAPTATKGGEDAAQADGDTTAPQAAPTRAPRAGLRDAAAAVLAAWDASPAQDATDNPISQAVEQLRTALASMPARTPRDPAAPRKAREGTKQETVLALLRRPEGATIAQISEATGWQQHTVRGFFAGLKRRQGIEVQVLERIRQVGPNKEGARGSYSIYRIAD
ncbi:DUF3489 domain-containing protein [Roseococcus sp. DSY-14]|uniref:DUF3489 domain-containing protein n=1 Tax=Roseococcus sp. DSY-14 TaxID=3369650 RepID=UPI00387B5F82